MTLALCRRCRIRWTPGGKPCPACRRNDERSARRTSDSDDLDHRPKGREREAEHCHKQAPATLTSQRQVQTAQLLIDVTALRVSAIRRLGPDRDFLSLSSDPFRLLIFPDELKLLLEVLEHRVHRVVGARPWLDHANPTESDRTRTPESHPLHLDRAWLPTQPSPHPTRPAAPRHIQRHSQLPDAHDRNARADNIQRDAGHSHPVPSRHVRSIPRHREATPGVPPPPAPTEPARRSAVPLSPSVFSTSGGVWCRSLSAGSRPSVWGFSDTGRDRGATPSRLRTEAEGGTPLGWRL